MSPKALAESYWNMISEYIRPQVNPDVFKIFFSPATVESGLNNNIHLKFYCLDFTNLLNHHEEIIEEARTHICPDWSLSFVVGEDRETLKGWKVHSIHHYSKVRK